MTKDIKEALKMVNYNQQKKEIIEQFNKFPKHIQEQILSENPNLFTEKYGSAGEAGAAAWNAFKKFFGGGDGVEDLGMPGSPGYKEFPKAPKADVPPKNPETIDMDQSPDGTWEAPRDRQDAPETKPGGNEPPEPPKNNDGELPPPRDNLPAPRQDTLPAPKDNLPARTPDAPEAFPGRSRGRGGPTAAQIAAGLLGGAAIGYGANKLIGGDDRDRQGADAAETDGGQQPQPQAAPPGTQPQQPDASSKKDEFKFTDAEKQGKVSADRLRAWATHVGIEKPEEATWAKYGRNFMNDAGKEGGTLRMRNAPKPSESQKQGEAAVKKAYGLGENFLSAFEKVVSSKSPNLFAEAAKKNLSEAGYASGSESPQYGRSRTWGPVNPMAGIGSGDNTGAIFTKGMTPLEIVDPKIQTAAFKAISSNGVRPGEGTISPANPNRPNFQQQMSSIGKQLGSAPEPKPVTRDKNLDAFRAADASSMKNVDVEDLNRIQRSDLSDFGKAFQTARSLQGISSNQADPNAMNAKNFAFKGKKFSAVRADEETIQEAKGSVPKTEKEKKLAALAEPKDKITHKDVLVGRGVVKEEEASLFSASELEHMKKIINND